MCAPTWATLKIFSHQVFSRSRCFGRVTVCTGGFLSWQHYWAWQTLHWKFLKLHICLWLCWHAVPSPWCGFATLYPAQYASKTLKSRPHINFTTGPLISKIWYHQLLFKNSSFCLFEHQGHIHCKLYTNRTNHQGTALILLFNTPSEKPWRPNSFPQLENCACSS